VQPITHLVGDYLQPLFVTHVNMEHAAYVGRTITFAITVGPAIPLAVHDQDIHEFARVLSQKCAAGIQQLKKEGSVVNRGSLAGRLGLARELISGKQPGSPLRYDLPTKHGFRVPKDCIWNFRTTHDSVAILVKGIALVWKLLEDDTICPSILSILLKFTSDEVSSDPEVTCNMSELNEREYFKWVIESKHFKARVQMGRLKEMYSEQSESSGRIPSARMMSAETENELDKYYSVAESVVSTYLENASRGIETEPEDMTKLRSFWDLVDTQYSLLPGSENGSAKDNAESTVSDI
jgi:hypothetical protein